MTTEQIDALECESNGLVTGDGRHRDAADIFAQAREALDWKAQAGKLAEALQDSTALLCPGPNQDKVRAALSTTAAQAGKDWLALQLRAVDRDAWKDACQKAVKQVEQLTSDLEDCLGSCQTNFVRCPQCHHIHDDGYVCFACGADGGDEVEPWP